MLINGLTRLPRNQIRATILVSDCVVAYAALLLAGLLFEATGTEKPWGGFQRPALVDLCYLGPCDHRLLSPSVDQTVGSERPRSSQDCLRLPHLPCVAFLSFTVGGGADAAGYGKIDGGILFFWRCAFAHLCLDPFGVRARTRDEARACRCLRSGRQGDSGSLPLLCNLHRKDWLYSSTITPRFMAWL